VSLGAKRTPLVKGLLRDMQIARLAPFEVNEKNAILTAHTTVRYSHFRANELMA